jgi:hypothetical protein
MSDYDGDIETWSERQADLLRRRAAGELVNDAETDRPNIADALAIMLETIDGQPPLPLPDVRPVTLDELLGERPGICPTRVGRCVKLFMKPVMLCAARHGVDHNRKSEE